MTRRAIFLVALALLAGVAVAADESWRAEFDRLCGKTEQSMDLPVAELRELVERCEKLRPRIEASGDPQAKVYVKRLEACRKVFAFVIESSGKAPR